MRRSKLNIFKEQYMEGDVNAVDCGMASDASWMEDDRYDKDERMGKMNGRCMNMHLIGRCLAGAHHHIRSPFADIHRQEGGKFSFSCFDSDPSYSSEPSSASEVADRREESRERERGGLDNDHKPPKTESKPADKKDPNSKDKSKDESKPECRVNVGAETKTNGETKVSGTVSISKSDEKSDQNLSLSGSINEKGEGSVRVDYTIRL